MARLTENAEVLLVKKKVKPHTLISLMRNSVVVGDEENRPVYMRKKHFLWDGTQDLTRRSFCPKCDKHYSCKSALNRHLKLECGKEPQFQCPECCRRYTQRSSLMAHFRKFHESLNTFSFNMSQK